MLFEEWAKLRENYKKTANKFSGLLNGVPQDPTHHPEGDALQHTKLVVKAIPNAIKELQKLKQDPQFEYILSNIDFSINPEEMSILKLAAWLHDIGKSSSTTVGGKTFLTRAPLSGKIQSIAHETPKHYMPQIEKFKDTASPEMINLFKKNEDMIRFMIDNHMKFTGGSFSKNFISQYFDNGKASSELKLLLILMWSDKMGRSPELVLKGAANNANSLMNSSNKSKVRHQRMMNQSRSLNITPEEFVKQKQTVLDKKQLKMALKGKYKMSDEEIFSLLGEQNEKKSIGKFRHFIENQEMNSQPTIVKGDIPVDQEVVILAKYLSMGSSNVESYLVGGAVRDWLNHHFRQNKGGFTPKDLDITTNLSEEEILEKLSTPEAQQAGIRVNEKESVDTFGVVFATVGKSDSYEIAPFRKDIGSVDGRRPEKTERGSIYDDAMRRDLTINNLYYDFGFGKYGKGAIIDLNENGQGIQDIKNNVARPVGDPEQRFNEDKLRILRLVRFFSRFNNGNILESLDEKTRQGIEKFKDLQSHGITPERIYMEFTGGIKQSLNTASYLRNIQILGLMPSVFGNLNVDFQGINKIDNSKNINVILAWLLRGNKNISQSLNALKYPNETTVRVAFLLKLLEQFKHGNNISSVHGLVKDRDRYIDPNYPEEHQQQLRAEMQNDIKEFSKIAGVELDQHRTNHFKNYHPPVISGKELMSKGLKGKEIGIEQNRIKDNHYKQSWDDYYQKMNVQK